jgi:hypothetical protein
MFLGSKVQRVRRAYSLTYLSADCLDNVCSVTSHNPIDLQLPLMRKNFTSYSFLPFFSFAFCMCRGKKQKGREH